MQRAIDIRLQLLEPGRYPYLFECLYSMACSCSSHKAPPSSLRNRLNAVNSAGLLHIAPKPPAPLPCQVELNLQLVSLQSAAVTVATRSSGLNFSPTFVLCKHGTSERVALCMAAHLRSALHSLRAPRTPDCTATRDQSRGGLDSIHVLDIKHWRRSR